MQRLYHKIQQADYSQPDENIGRNCSPDKVVQLVNDKRYQHDIKDIEKVKFQETEVEVMHAPQVIKIYLYA